MEPSVKIMEYIMLVIIIIMALNYAEYIELDPKLVMLLFSIALYVAHKCGTDKSKVEGINGSPVAFDKDAFTNLNKLINQLVNKEQVRIPGNLVVDGTITVKNTKGGTNSNTITGTTNITGATNITGDVDISKSLTVFDKRITLSAESSYAYVQIKDKKDDKSNNKNTLNLRSSVNQKSIIPGRVDVNELDVKTNANINGNLQVSGTVSAAKGKVLLYNTLDNNKKELYGAVSLLGKDFGGHPSKYPAYGMCVYHDKHEKVLLRGWHGVKVIASQKGMMVNNEKTSFSNTEGIDVTDVIKADALVANRTYFTKIYNTYGKILDIIGRSGITLHGSDEGDRAKIVFKKDLLTLEHDGAITTKSKKKFFWVIDHELRKFYETGEHDYMRNGWKESWNWKKSVKSEENKYKSYGNRRR